jgi:nitrate reductase beta subunit
LIRKIESEAFPVQALQAIHELRAYLDDLEATHLLKARELGASPTDIAEALGITRQAVYNKLRSIERASHEERIVIPDQEEPPEAEAAADVSPTLRCGTSTVSLRLGDRTT